MPDPLVTVDKFQSLPEAEVARMHLDAEGIWTFLSDAETVNMDWLMGNALGYIKLQVPPAQAQAAFTLLDDMHARRSQRTDHSAGEPEALSCLACGAQLAAVQASCPTCGWTYANVTDPVPLEQSAGPQDLVESRRHEVISGMGILRSMKRPVLFFFLALSLISVVPFVIAIALILYLLALLTWLGLLLWQARRGEVTTANPWQLFTRYRN